MALASNQTQLRSVAIPIVLPHITCRLAASSWLIGVTFILIFLGCFLRTEFTTESYVSIDTISDLIQTGIPPTFMEGTGTFEYLKVLAIEDPIDKEWLHGLDQEKLFTTYIDYMKLEGYIRIHSGEKALIVGDSYINWMMGEFLTSDSESKEFFVNQGGLYFSKNNLYFDYFHIIFNTSWLKSTPQMHENLKLSLQPFFESQSFKYMDFEVNHFIEQVKWRRPLKIPVQLDLSSVFVPFYWLCMLLFGAVAVFVTEILFNQFV